MKSKKSETEYINGFLKITRELLKNEYVESMKTFDHHGSISTHFHSLHVAYTVYKKCIDKNLPAELTEEITVASLLHDFYLYNWPTEKHEENHIFYHPKESVRNIERTGITEINEMQRNMILFHMFPAAHFPDSKGGWMLTIADKICATKELSIGKKCFNKTYEQIMEARDNA